MDNYLKLFIDEIYPSFIDKYLHTNTLKRLKHVTQFCGCDYTKLYSPLFLYTRFDHSLVVAHMTWHFTHDKKETLAALFHDVGTPCFAHCIDYVFGDYLNQETSEKSIVEVLKLDEELCRFLKEDGLSVKDFICYDHYPILENKSPKLCTDRLDGVLHTAYIWLHVHSLEEIKEVYDNIVVLENEEGQKEIGFQDIKVGEKFLEMVYLYAKELQGNTDKYVMKYISEIVKQAFQKNLITLEDLYTKKEEEICHIFDAHITSWKKFRKANTLVRTEEEPKHHFYISFATKKRNVIFLVQTKDGSKRITEVSNLAKEKYDELEKYKDTTYAFIKEVESLD